MVFDDRSHRPCTTACNFHDIVQHHVCIYTGTIVDKMGSAVHGVPCHAKCANLTLEPRFRMRHPGDQRNVRDRDTSRRYVETRLGHGEPRVDIGYMGYVSQNGHELRAHLASIAPCGQADGRDWLYYAHPRLIHGSLDGSGRVRTSILAAKGDGRVCYLCCAQ